MSASADTVDRAFIAGHYGTTSYRAWGSERLERYDQKLKAVSRTSKVIPHQLYVEE